MENKKAAALLLLFISSLLKLSIQFAIYWLDLINSIGGGEENGKLDDD